MAGSRHRSAGRVAVVLALALASFAARVPAHAPPSDPMAPNIVLILTDDQRWDTLWAMPIVQSELVAKGVNFTNGFVVNSLCCPSRTSILTGEYSHSTLVYGNVPPQGGFTSFNDASNVATWLHDAGYHTGMLGKYLNGYTEAHSSYVPPGWDRWFALLQRNNASETDAYFNYNVTDQGVETHYGSAETDYLTDVLSGQADEFIRGTDAAQPLFMYLAVHAPHAPATPAPRHATAFSDLPPFRPPSYNEADVSDKPNYIQRQILLNQKQKRSLDLFRINQYRTLLAVDEAVSTVITALTDTGRLSNTMIVFASDNGLTYDEHRWQRAKIAPYEESARIPFVVRYDPLTQGAALTDDHLVTNIDLAPTFAELAGVPAPGVEGVSLMPLLTGSPVEWRTDFLMEHLHYKDPVPTYCAVRTEGYVYITYGDGFEEMYDLTADPYELTNIAGDVGYTSTENALRARDQVLCSPVPHGFVWPYDALPPTVPQDLAGNAPLRTEVDLSWTASTDNVAVAGYTIYRDGVLLDVTTGGATSFVDLTALPDSTYAYTVDAFDAAGNHSAQSTSVVVTTPP